MSENKINDKHALVHRLRGTALNLEVFPDLPVDRSQIARLLQEAGDALFRAEWAAESLSVIVDFVDEHKVKATVGQEKAWRSRIEDAKDALERMKQP